MVLPITKFVIMPIAKYGIIFAWLCLGFACESLAANEAWWKTEDPGQPPELASVLGSEPTAWTVTTPNGLPLRATLTELDGQAVLFSTNSACRLGSLTRYGSNIEIQVDFRLAPPEKKGASLTLTTGLGSPSDSKDSGHSLAVSIGGGRELYSLRIDDPLPKNTNSPKVNLIYRPVPALPNMLAWPERVRRTVEHEIASLEPATSKWLTLRYQTKQGCARAYLNDRLLMERVDSGLNVSGFMRIDFSPYVCISRVRVRRLLNQDALFEPLSLKGHWNSALINGRRIDRSGMPPDDTLVQVRGAPFLFSGPDKRGNDHIDVGASWLQTGSLEAPNWPQQGGVGGRWIGALYENPSRLKFSVPNARYKALHLIAAADDGPESVPVITALFYRPAAGHPVGFAGDVPLFSASSADTRALPVRLESGRKGRLYHVTIPLNPDLLGLFADLPVLEFELTKKTQLFRAYPDPMFYSVHGAGLPSSAHVFAMTLEKPELEVEFEPDAYAHVWVAPASPRYTVWLRNRSGVARAITLALAVTAADGAGTTAPPTKVIVPPGGSKTASFAVLPARYGFNTAVLTVIGDGMTNKLERNLAWLQRDTRQRGKWREGQGPCFGFWNWRGGHLTPPAERQTYLMALAGCESESGSFAAAGEDEQKTAEQFGMVTYKAFGGGDHWITGALVNELASMPEAAALSNMVAKLRKNESKASAFHKPAYISFFPEPGLGAWDGGNWPDYWGEAPYSLSEAQEKRYKAYERAFVLGAAEVKKIWPDVKRLMPHGDPMFPLLFLRRSAAVRGLIDGMAVDIAGFERLPEQQLHQVSMHRLYYTRREFAKAGISNAVFPNYEGPIVPSKPGAVPPAEAADLNVRNALIQLAYGVNPLLGAWPMAECANYWGEQHYGAGLCHRLPRIMPERSYAAVATLTRHLNRRNFTRWLPTGSLSVYALEFRHYETGAPLHVLWTIRGRRDVMINLPSGASLRVFDQMDNKTIVRETNGVAAVTISPSPCFIYGVSGDMEIAALGKPDHSDAVPAKGGIHLTSLGSGKWEVSNEEDHAYASNHFYHIRRTPALMSAKLVPAPENCAARGQALAVAIGQQSFERGLMPFYTTLVPQRPVSIPGKASHLGLWVRASSDWGRVVYSLRDARGERWISVGKKNEWNGDDVHSWSYFCFDGWRYLRFELPANSPWDAYRENGSTWWGAVPGGDGIVDLPLTLEKIIVERRTRVMHVNDPQPANTDDVLLGDLYAEYAAPADASSEALRLSRLRMPVPSDAPELGNPIEALMQTGTANATTLTYVDMPAHEFDGTRCHVFFEEIKGVKTYDIWASPYIDGRGAVQLGKDWPGPGRLVQGLRPDTDFYLFVVCFWADGRHSKPSAPLKINLTPAFAFK